MEGRKRRKLSLKIKRDSNNVEVVPGKTVPDTKDRTYKESKGLVRSVDTGKENTSTVKNRSAGEFKADKSSDQAFRNEHKKENTLQETKKEVDQNNVSTSQLTPLQLALRKLEQRMASQYSSWDIPPFPGSEALQAESPELNTSKPDTSRIEMMTSFPSPCMKCAEAKSAMKNFAPITNESHEKPSLKESLKQLFSVENLSTTLSSSQPEVDFSQNNVRDNSKIDNKTTDAQARTTNVASWNDRHLKPEIREELSILNPRTVNFSDISQPHRNSIKRDTEVKERPVDEEKGENSSKERTDNNDVLQQCPLCQVLFPRGTSQLEKDGHIAQCLSMAGDDAMW